MPLEWPVRPRVVSVQVLELRRATVPRSWPSFRGQSLELEREIRLAAGGDQIAAGDGKRAAGPLLVAGQNHGDVDPAQQPRLMKRAQRREHDDVAALHVVGAGAGRAIALPAPALERARRLEHRVEMADQQNMARRVAAVSAAKRAVGGDEMAGAAGLGHVDPAHLHPDRLEFGAQKLGIGADAVAIQSPAILVHQPFEQGDVAIGLAGYGRGHGPLLRREAGLGGDGEGEQQ